MKQALHIFRKDISYLRYDITITILIASAFALAVQHLPALGTILPILWFFLIARLIHAEALPGFRQFWLTRPYEWRSLLAAKMLFILVFVCLPLLLADLLIILMAGFPIGSELGGLLWTQILVAAAIVLPAAVVSALTSGLAELLLTTLAVTLGVVAWQVAGWWIRWDMPWFELDWVRTYWLLTLVSIAALIILLWQYARRNTFIIRIVTIGSAALLLTTYMLFPWRAAFALQTHFSQRDLDASSIQISLDSQRKWLGRIYTDDKDRMVAELPLQIKGIPANTELRPNGLNVTLIAPSGETWVSNDSGPEGVNFESGITSLRAVMASNFYSKVRNQPLQLRGKFFFTLFGDRRVTPIPLTGRPIVTADLGVCEAAPQLVLCRYAFRTPAGMVSINTLQGSGGSPTLRTEKLFFRNSYSPFPAEFTIDPVYQESVRQITGPIIEAHVEALQPVAYLERDFVINQVRLDDYLKIQ